MEAHEWTSVLGFAARQGCKMSATRAPADFSKASLASRPCYPHMTDFILLCIDVWGCLAHDFSPSLYIFQVPPRYLEDLPRGMLLELLSFSGCLIEVSHGST